MAVKQVRARAHHQKSVHGCATCKIRRVKCDEGVPECRRCLDTGRRCEGPKSGSYIFVQNYSPTTNTSPKSIHSPADSSPDAFSSWLSTDEERRAFSYYLCKAAPLLSGALDLRVWGVLLPQIAQQNIAVRHAVLAVSGLFEQPVRENGSLPIDPQHYTEYQKRALKWYGRALSAQRSVAHAPDEPYHPLSHLLTLLLFACVEIQQGNFSTGIDLFYTGFKILAPLLANSHTQTQLDIGKDETDQLGVIVSMFMRNVCLLSTSATVGTILTEVTMFETLDEACEVLFRLLCAIYGSIKEMYVAAATMQMTNDDYRDSNTFSNKTHLKELLLAWKFRMDSWSANHTTPTEQASASYLHCYYNIAITWLGVSSRVSSNQLIQDPELLFSDVVDCSRRIVDQYRDIRHPPAFFFDMAILAPLYMTVIWSISPELQNQAFEIMKQYTSQKQRGQLHGLLVSSRQPEIHNNNVSHDIKLIIQIFRVHYRQEGEPEAIEFVHYDSG